MYDINVIMGDVDAYCDLGFWFVNPLLYVGCDTLGYG